MGVAIDGLLKSLKEINSIGDEEGEGITRLALTSSDIMARDYVKNRFAALGMEVHEDGIGNIWAKKNGYDVDASSIIIGSHIDTVPNGGGYDGTLGVMTAIEVVEIINEQNIRHKHSIEIVVFSIEESSRFNISTVGSKYITGGIDISTLKKNLDKDGVSVYEALVENSYTPGEINFDKDKVKAFIELHIEQGPVLETEKLNIGVVSAIAAPTRIEIDLFGEEAHSGSCPMNLRKDVLTAAAEIILDIESEGRDESLYGTVSTVGILRAFPCVMNVVPGKAVLVADIRGIENKSILRAVNHIIDKVGEICQRRKIEYKISMISKEEPIELDCDLSEVIKRNCKKLSLTFKEMASGAGHDTMNMAKIVPSALIFIPCIKGISHNKKEDVKSEDIFNGLKILYETVIDLAK